MSEVSDSDMNGEELTVKRTVVFIGGIAFSAEKNQEDMGGTINDLVVNSARSNVAGIHGKEEGCIMEWKTQGRGCCEKFFACNKGFLLLCLPQERLCFAGQSRMQGRHGVGGTWNKSMIIIYHPHEFLEFLDGCRALEIGNCVDLSGEREYS